MFKKMMLASAILATSFSVQASPYVGGSVGVNVNSSTHSAGGNPGVFRGIPVNVFAGYGALISQTFYLAGELTGTLGTGEISNSNLMKTSYGVGLSLIPGVMLNDSTLGYVRGGYVRTRFSSVNRMVGGGMLGLGLQTALTQNLDLRGEYDYTDYNNARQVQSPRSDEYTVGIVYRID